MSQTIPVVLCIRPGGRRVDDVMTVPAEYETPEKLAKLQENLALLRKYEIDITAEQVGGNQVNVCLDNGEFDYKFELFPGDAKLLVGITELVLNFDEQEYLKAYKAFETEQYGEDTRNG